MTEHLQAEPVGRPDANIPVLDVDPFALEFLEDPYRFHEELREAGPVFWLSKYDIYATARSEQVVQVLQDHATFCSGRGVGLADFSREQPFREPSLLLEADPPLHDRTRRLMNRVVSPGAIRARQEEWRQKAQGLVRELAELKRFDAVKDLAEVFPMAIFPDTIGLPEDGRHHLITYAMAIFNAFGPRNALFQETAAQAAEASAWVAEACKRESLSPDGWGMDVYRAADEGLCSEDEARRLIRSFLSAGVDTTINGIGNLIEGFVVYPDQWALLRSNPQLYRKKAFEEALRWNSTAQTFFRTSVADTELAGVPIRAGAKILVFLAAANRDPRRWDRPNDFDIARNASGHVAFGFGIHQCLGQMVARAEAEVLVDAMVQGFKSITAMGPAVRRPNNTLLAIASLPVEVEG